MESARVEALSPCFAAVVRCVAGDDIARVAVTPSRVVRSLRGLLWALCVASAPACSRRPSSAVHRAPTVAREVAPSPAERADVPATPPSLPPRDPLAPPSLRATVEALAAPSMEGREPETRGDDEARALIESTMRHAGLAAPKGGFQHPFTFENDDEDIVHTANVVGILRGADPQRADEVVLVGAHHDHLGREGRRLFPGANDNATGVSLVLAVAEALAQRRVALPRTVAFVTFGAEEEGLHGSAAWVRSPPEGLSIAQTMFMLNVDMVGSYSSDGCLYALHTFRGTPGRVALDRLTPAYPDLRVELGDPGDDSDHVNFCAAGVPTTFFYTPDPRCHHRPCDTAARIEWDHLSRIAHLAYDLVVSVAGADDLAARRAAGCRPFDGPRERRE